MIQSDGDESDDQEVIEQRTLLHDIDNENDNGGDIEGTLESGARFKEEDLMQITPT